ncbi:Zinc finger protein 416 [Manis javanica]|nr:Zinc finger protein 416 [Manis javanica]
MSAGTWDPAAPTESDGGVRLRDPARGCVTFEDVAVSLSGEEWGLLAEAQRLLYREVMLENLALMASLVSWHGIENEETPFEQSVSIQALSQVGIPKVGLSIRNTHPCEKCVPILKDILYLCNLPGQKAYVVGAHQNLHQVQKLYSPEKRNAERPSFVRSCIFRASGNPLTCRKVEKETPTTLSLLQLHVIPYDDKLNKSTKCAGAFHGGKSHCKSCEYGKASSHKHSFLYHLRGCTTKRAYESRNMG